MPSLLSRPWFARLVVAGALAACLPAGASAAWTWPWSRPAAPAIPVGPPIYTPNPTPTVVGYQPAPAAAVAPTLLPGPASAPPATYAPAPYAAPTAIAAPGVCGQCGAPRTTAGYAPPNYRTNWMQVPTTTYRPVVTVDPATGQPINAVVPCTTNAWQARRVPTSLWGGLWPSTAAPPNTVVYTPATIAAYPPPVQYRGYAPSATVIAPRPTVTQYAPQYAQPYGPPVVTNYVPTHAPAPVATCPHGNCPAGSCPSATTVVPSTTTPAPYYSAPATTYPSATSPPTTAPLRTSPSTTFPATPRGGEPADVRPRLEGTIRSYTPSEYDNEPVVPVTPPGRVIETPRNEGLRLQSPQNGSSSSSKSTPPVSPWIPFARPSDKPASTSAPSGLKLLPDPDAEKLDLRKHEIPNLIQPGDRTTERSSAPRSVPVAWPAKEAPRGLELSQPKTRAIPAEIPATPVNDGGWKSLAR